ncbi:MAG: B12-binding domain-containing radical SAM protein [Eubacteriaceae bacterium]
MKIVLTSLNSKFIHTNLALRYLKANLSIEKVHVQLTEYTINDTLDSILGDLYTYNGDIYAFSCYIWNIEETLKVVNNLKAVLPNCLIILGGPEATFNANEILNNTNADIIVKGEGEITFYELIKKIYSNTHYIDLDGIVFKDDNNNIVNNKDRRPLDNLDNLVFPYIYDDMSSYKNQILYYEGSRGCPFKCSYCLSSIDRKVRNFSLKRIKEDLSILLQNKVKQVKFVDRTFNSNIKRAKEIVDFIIRNNNNITNFHFEIAGDLLDDEIIKMLNNAPTGLFQLEIGVQSVNKKTLCSINRTTNIDKIESNLSKLNKSIHIHLDLIAGLPFEDYNSFKKSFNRVYNMDSHMLQLGFLKLLKGSPIEKEKSKFSYRFNQFPPYEIFSNDFIDYNELLHLKKIEYLIDKYYNSGGFQNTIRYILATYYKAPYEFYDEFSNFWIKNDLYKTSHNKDKIYKILIDFLYSKSVDIKIINNFIKYDYLLFNKWPLPSFLNSNALKKEKVFELLKDHLFIKKYLPQYEKTPAKNIYKQIYMELFDFNITSFEYLRNEEVLLIFYKDEKGKTSVVHY